MLASDIAAVMLLEQASGEAAHWPLAQYALLVERGAAAGESLIRRLGLVADMNGRVVGFLAGRAVAGDGEAELENMAVAAGERKHGIGAALLREFLEWCAAGGHGRVHLEVRESNAAARRLYARHGFVVAGRRKNYYKGLEAENGAEDAVTMVLAVTAGNRPNAGE